MRLPPALVAPAGFVAAACLAVLAAFWAAGTVERRTLAEVQDVFRREGLTWVTAATDGLQVHLTGTAPTEAQRFRAMNLTGSIVDAGRIRDRMEVTPARAIEAPHFSVELLRNNDGISLIGLIPGVDGQRALADAVAGIAQGAQIADMLTEADFPAPEGWERATGFGLAALQMLPRSKISISADKVSVTAIANSVDEKRRLETELARARPQGLGVAIDISAPRPVLTPFTLRFLKDSRGARFDACAADTERARDAIVAAAVAAGMTGKADCPIGLGVPTPRWAEAAVAGIGAIADLGAGTITFADADVTLLATVDTPQATYDRVVGELEAALPDVFSLNATLPEKPKTAKQDGPAEFTAQLSPEGKVELHGGLTDAALKNAVTSFAQASFGAGSVYTATRLDPELPDGWPVRVLAGLKALSQLHEGTLVVQADTVEVAGVTGHAQARASIARTLSGTLGQGQAFKVDVRYDEALDPLAALPTPQECVADLNAVLAKTKIAFAPGSADIEAAGGKTLDALAAILKRCPDIAMEIAGHTDSQGSEGGNLALSTARAQAVLLGLQGRRVDVSRLAAAGYGEGRPVADNDDEAGREANRRIEFSLRDVPAAMPLQGPVPPTPSVPVTRPDAADAGGAAAPPPADSGGTDGPVATTPAGSGATAGGMTLASSGGSPGLSVMGSGSGGGLGGLGGPAAAAAAALPEDPAAARWAPPDAPFVSAAPTDVTLRPRPRPSVD